MTSRPPIGVLATAGAVVLGILLGRAAGPSAAAVALGLAAVVAVVAYVVRRRALRVAAGLIACTLLGCAVMQRALHGLVASPLAPLVAARDALTARGELVGDPAGGRWDVTAMIRVRSFRTGRGGWRDAGGRHVLVNASGDTAMRIRVLSAGDGLTLRGWLEPLRGLATRERWRHAVAVLHATELTAMADPSSPVVRISNAAREIVLAGGNRLHPVDRALLSGFLVGDTRALPYDLTQEFRAAGLSHLLVVSGENVAFVLALFSPLLRRLSLSGRLAAGLAILVLFGTMTRWEPSVLRAVAMASIAMIAGFLGRPTTGLRTLALAATALLLADPFLLFSVGFALSCGASFGIAVLARPTAERLRGPRWLRDALAVTAAAQFGVAPVLIPVFGSMPLVSFPANLVAVPLAGPLTVWGLAAGMVGGGLAHGAPPIARLLELPTVGLLHAVIAVADVASRVPFEVDGRAACGLVAITSLAAAVTRTHRARRAARDARPQRAAHRAPR